MKSFACSAMTALLVGVLFTQAALPVDSTRVQSKSITLSGQVSHDGKRLLADDDNTWVVSNADSLKGMEGRYVSVRCRMDVKGGSIRVLSIVDQPRTTHGARLDDAAFRR